MVLWSGVYSADDVLQLESFWSALKSSRMHVADTETSSTFTENKLKSVGFFFFQCSPDHHLYLPHTPLHTLLLFLPSSLKQLFQSPPPLLPSLFSRQRADAGKRFLSPRSFFLSLGIHFLFWDITAALRAFLRSFSATHIRVYAFSGCASELSLTLCVFNLFSFEPGSRYQKSSSVTLTSHSYHLSFIMDFSLLLWHWEVVISIIIVVQYYLVTYSCIVLK